jgi:hypothetical protein
MTIAEHPLHLNHLWHTQMLGVETDTGNNLTRSDKTRQVSRNTGFVSITKRFKSRVDIGSFIKMSLGNPIIQTKLLLHLFAVRID